MRGLHEHSRPGGFANGAAGIVGGQLVEGWNAGALAITALAEDRLAQDDLDGAIALTERLEGDALDAARDWLISARARQDLDLRLTRLRQALADDATAQGADPL